MTAAAPPPLTDFDWAVRWEVFTYFASCVEAPTADALGRRLGVEPEVVAGSLRRLQSNHHVGLFPDRDEVWIANPFSAVPTDYPVETERGRFWAACAWDAFGVSAILGIDGWTEARCAGSGEALSFGVRGGDFAGDEGVVHLVVPLRDAWDDIGFT